MKFCFMFGHSDCPEEMLPTIASAIEGLYRECDVRIFYVGNRGRFDSLTAAAARLVKVKYPDLSLQLVLSYHPGDRAFVLPEGFDGSYYPPLEGIPSRYAILRGNQFMVDSASVILCYVRHPGNTRNLLDYAQRRVQVPIKNLALSE